MRTFGTVTLAALAACGGDGSATAKSDYGGYYDTGDVDASFGSSTTNSEPAPPPPPEEEQDLLLLPPAQTDRYVFVANPDRDTVTRITVADRSVVTLEVGAQPSIVVTTADYAAAVVLETGDDTVSILDADTLGRTVVPVRPNLNTLALSPDGRWAVGWRDEDLVDEEADPGELQSFNEASFVEVATGVHEPMAVGFNPKQVVFTPDGTLALVVSDAYLAVVDLTVRPLSPALIELPSAGTNEPTAEEVVLSPDGTFAWVRPFAEDALWAIDLQTHVIESLLANSDPTDLDLSPDGEQVVMVSRSGAELWVLDANDPYGVPVAVPLPDDGDYGSLVFAPDGQKALLYTNATRLDRYAVWDLTNGTVTERSLVKPVSSVVVAPGGGAAMIFHTKEDGPDTEPLFAGEWAMTLVDLGDLRTNPLLLPAEPLAYANSPSGERGYFVMDGAPYFEVLDYVTLLHTQLELPSLPRFVGVLPDDAAEPVAWVSEDHPLGRIGFYDPADGSLETLTGFELNAGVED